MASAVRGTEKELYKNESKSISRKMKEQGRTVPRTGDVRGERAKQVRGAIEDASDTRTR